MTRNISMRDFLIRFTSVPKTFIDKHVDFYEKCEKDEFGILLSDVIKYLEITKPKRFMKRFRDKYKLGVDYKKKITNTQKTKGSEYVQYYINLDTFERICLSTRSENGDRVRDYLLQ